MNKYRVFLRGWDFETDQVIEAKSATKAKGQYISKFFDKFNDGYHKNVFFSHLRCNKIKSKYE